MPLLLLCWGCLASKTEKLDDTREMRIFAYYSTTSVTSLYTKTTTIPSTCMSVKDTACARRRRSSAKYKKINMHDK